MNIGSINLMFHDVVSDTYPHSGFQTIGSKQYTLSAAEFEALVKGAESLSMDVTFTFDDGGSSFYTIIAPILERYHRKGVFFITTARIGTPGFLSTDQIVELHKRGHIVASHSHTHPANIGHLPLDIMRDEWQTSKQILEGIIKSPVTTASLPGGSVSNMVLKVMAELGYTDIYTSAPLLKAKKMYHSNIMGRYTIYRASTIDDVRKIVDNNWYRWQLGAKYRCLNIVKRMLGSKYIIVKDAILRRFVSKK
jgi:peptidoglycan/xylan/chitin deacetylase (PgdA/CDA1 family)